MKLILDDKQIGEAMGEYVARHNMALGYSYADFVMRVKTDKDEPVFTCEVELSGEKK